MNKNVGTWLTAAAYLGACVPLVVMLWEAWRGTLSVEPIREAQLRTGRWALTFLIASLAPTPLARLTGYGPLLELRRAFGLVAFTYALLHLLNFVWIDYGFNFTFLRQDLFQKEYALAGLAAFLLMAPAFAGSFGAVRRRMGAWWRRLRWFIYAAAVAGVVHLFWSTKAGFTPDYIYAGVLGALLVLRLPYVDRLRLRRGSSAQGEPVEP